MTFLHLQMHIHLSLTLVVCLHFYTKVFTFFMALSRGTKESENYENDASVTIHDSNEWYVLNAKEDKDIFEEILLSVCYINSY